MYKKKSYNVIMACLLIVISMVVGTSMGMVFSADPKKDNVQLPDNSTAPSFSEPETNQTFGGLSKPSATTSSLKRLEYAVAVIKHGAGYTSDTVFHLNVLGNHQYVFFKRYSGGGYNVVEEWYQMTGFASNVGLNYFVGYYSHEDDYNYLKITDKSGFSFQDKTYTYTKAMARESLNKSAYLERRNNMPINDFFAPINKNTVQVNYNDNARGKDYYTIKATMNGEALKSQFLGALASFGPVTIDIGAVNITFKIDKKTGFMLGYELDAVFYADAFGLSGSANLTIQEQYTTMNTSAEEKIKAIGKNNFGLA